MSADVDNVNNINVDNMDVDADSNVTANADNMEVDADSNTTANTDNNVKEKKPGGLSVWLCIPLFFILFLVFTGLYGALTQLFLSLVLGVDVRHPGAVGYILLETGMLIATLTASAITLRLERRPFSDLGLSVRGHAKGLWYGFLAAVLLYFIGFGLSLAMGEVEVTGFRFSLSELSVSWLFFLSVALFEEILMRGYVLGRLLHTRLNKFLSLFISATLFAFLHIFNPDIGILPMVNLLLAGILLGASYLYTRNLCFPISLHLFWNWIQGPVLGYQVSGNNFMSTMLELHIPEENVLNGGAFGFEGSLICTVLMIVFTMLIIWWGEKREAISLAVPRSC